MPCNVTLRPVDTSRETESNECVLEIGFLSSGPHLRPTCLSPVFPRLPHRLLTRRIPGNTHREIVAFTSPGSVTLLCTDDTSRETPSDEGVLGKRKICRFSNSSVQFSCCEFVQSDDSSKLYDATRRISRVQRPCYSNTTDHQVQSNMSIIQEHPVE